MGGVNGEHYVCLRRQKYVKRERSNTPLSHWAVLLNLNRFTKKIHHHAINIIARELESHAECELLVQDYRICGPIGICLSCGLLEKQSEGTYHINGHAYCARSCEDLSLIIQGKLRCPEPTFAVTARVVSVVIVRRRGWDCCVSGVRG